VWLIWAVVCLSVAPWVQMSVNVSNEWLHNAAAVPSVHTKQLSLPRLKTAVAHASNLRRQRYGNSPQLLYRSLLLPNNGHFHSRYSHRTALI